MNFGVQGFLGQYIHFAIKQFADVHLKTAQSQARSTIFEFYQKIDVTIGMNIIACHRSKYPNIAHAIFSGE